MNTQMWRTLFRKPWGQPRAPAAQELHRSKSLVARLLLMIMLAILPLKALEIVNLVAFHGAEVREIKRRTLDVAKNVTQNETQVIEDTHEVMRIVATLEAVRHHDGKACNALLTTLAPQHANLSSLGVVDRNGVRYCSSADPFPGAVSLADRSFFRLAVERGDFVVAEFRMSDVSKIPVLDLAQPFFDGSGVLAGVVYAGLNLGYTEGHLMQRPMPADAELIMADRNGAILASAPDQGWTGRKLPPAHLDVLNRGDVGLATLAGLDGAPRMFAYVPVNAASSGGIYVAYGVKRDAALAKVDRAEWRGGALIIGGIVMALLVGQFMGRLLIRRPFSDLLSAMRRWESGDWTARVPNGPDVGECTVMAHAFNKLAQTVAHELAERKNAEVMLAQSNAELEAYSNTLERQTARAGMLATMSQRLQCCVNDEELAECIRCFGKLIFASIPGVLYLFDEARDRLHAVATWSEPKAGTADFACSECWGLRRGQIHEIADASGDLVCAHLRGRSVSRYSCRPLIVRGEAIGLIYLEFGAEPINSATGHDLDVFTESLALAVANHQLRESLRAQSIRDPLTGLYNRRYLGEMLERDLARAARTGEAFSVIMANLDHFKRFNDGNGHDAGDHVLKLFAQLLTAQTRKEDVVSRFGGEEFLILLRGASADEAAIRAEKICAAARTLDATFNGTPLGAITTSCGVAAFPENARDARALLKAADTALYAAKNAGRDQVATFASARDGDNPSDNVPQQKAA